MFAPIAKLNIVRLMIVLKTKNNWKLHWMDVKSTFLNVELKEVYLFQTMRFCEKGTRTYCMQVKERTIWFQIGSQIIVCESSNFLFE